MKSSTKRLLYILLAGLEGVMGPGIPLFFLVLFYNQLSAMMAKPIIAIVYGILSLVTYYVIRIIFKKVEWKLSEKKQTP